MVDPFGADQLMLELLPEWRHAEAAAQGYGPGNILNPLRLSRGNLQSVDVSSMRLRHAYLVVEAQDANLAHAWLEDAILAQPFEVKYRRSLRQAHMHCDMQV